MDAHESGYVCGGMASADEDAADRRAAEKAESAREFVPVAGCEECEARGAACVECISYGTARELTAYEKRSKEIREFERYR